jgi:epoxyqueuosine reductase QueG
VRACGHDALASGNDTLLSVPLAMRAGLGRRGRHGLLLTNGAGPFVRICKVFTDMHLVPDAPAPEEVADACAGCRLCADACPARAIDPRPEPAGSVRTVDSAACAAHWRAGNAGCCLCQASCPFPEKPAADGRF